MLNAFESQIFSIKSEGTSFLNVDHYFLKVLTSKQMLLRLPITLTQAKSANTFKNLLN